LTKDNIVTDEETILGDTRRQSLTITDSPDSDWFQGRNHGKKVGGVHF
jgi:hypothetical protein